MPATLLIISNKLPVYEPIWLHAPDTDYRTRLVDNYADGGRVILDEMPHVAILDVDISQAAALRFLRRLRRSVRTRHLPVIAISSHTDEHDCTMILEAGADDYITAPFSTRELFARVGAVTRRRTLVQPARPLTYGALTVEPATRRIVVRLDDKDIDLKSSVTEFNLLYLLITHAGQVLSREQVLDSLWRHGLPPDIRTVDVHVGRLRALLRCIPTAVRIEAIKTQGYRVVAEEEMKQERIGVRRSTNNLQQVKESYE